MAAIAVGRGFAMSAATVSRRQRQRGWSLVEAVVVVMLMGVMAVGLWKIMGLVQRSQGGEQSRELVQRAEHALLGRLLRDHALPRPDAAVPSPVWPNHLEGWLPVDVLGTEPPRRIRYLVDQALLAPPTSLYQADPLGLLPTGGPAPLGPAPRTVVNGLDVCLTLIRQEKAQVTAAAGLRLAFGVQTRGTAGSAGLSANDFVLGNPAVGSPGSLDQLNTRALGYSELVHQLGCFPAFARLATEVKAAVLADDLHSQAELNADLHDLMVRGTRESIANATWRIVNCATRLAVSTWNTANATVTTRTTPYGLVAATGTLATFALEAALWTEILKFSVKSLEGNLPALPLAEQARDAAYEYSAQMAQQRQWHLDRANDFQNRGVMP